MKPNFLVIFLDQLRWDCINCNGKRLVKTPNIDRIAAEGVNFNQAYSTTPVCIPARHNLLTGKYSHKTGVMRNGHHSYQNPDIPTVANLLTRGGYFTQAIGKMHFFPERAHHGFQRMLLSEEIPFYRQDDDYLMFLKENGFDIEEQHGLRHEKYYHPQVTELPEEFTSTAWVGNQTVEFLRQNRNRPFFCFTSFIHPHPPWAIPETSLNDYNPDDMPLPICGEEDREFFADRILSELYALNLHDADENFIRKMIAYYYTTITLVDKYIGKILDALEKYGLKENTIVFFTSDHGEFLGDHHLWGKSLFYESSAKVPFLVSWPGHFKNGEKREQLVNLCDIMPTVLNHAGIPIPEDCQGMDLTPIINDNSAPWRDSLIGEIEQGNGLVLMYRQNDWKYMYFSAGARERLYNLKDDPNELKDLSKEKPDLCREFKSKLVTYYKDEGYDRALEGDDLIQTPIVEKKEFRVNSQYPRWPYNDPDMNGPKRATSMPAK